MNALLPVVLTLWMQAPVEQRKPPVEEYNTDHLVGVYKIVASEKSGKETAKEEIEDAAVRITSEKIVMTDRNRKETFAATYKINAKPATMTITMVSTLEKTKGATVKGLVDIGDRMIKLIYTLPEGNALPTEFKTQEGQVMVLLEKVYPPQTARKPGAVRR